VQEDNIKALIFVAQEELKVIKELKKIKISAENTIYKLYYDILHTLVEAFVKIDKMKISNHECLFAYLCNEHPELEFDWNFFQKVRTKRNCISYYGTLVSKENLKEVELQFNLYIKSLQELINRKLP
jgi:hypothetical protein